MGSSRAAETGLADSRDRDAAERFPFFRHPLRFLKGRARMLLALPPLSLNWGLDRGLPAHRYYLKHFLGEFSGDIRGECLEFQDPFYLREFGGDAVTKADVIHLDASNPHATVIADITRHEQLPVNRFDCIICTHVLHTIFDMRAAVRGLRRMLKNRGVLLVAVPHISMCSRTDGELWRFTEHGLQMLLEDSFGAGSVDVRAYGNSYVAAGELRGLVTEEFTRAELHAHDPRFAMELCARAVK